MHFSKVLLGAGLAHLGLAAYTLKDDYSGNNFANMFSFDTVSPRFSSWEWSTHYGLRKMILPMDMSTTSIRVLLNQRVYSV